MAQRRKKRAAPVQRVNPSTTQRPAGAGAIAGAGFVAQRVERSSPIPMPDVLLGYDRVVPGSAELILDLYRQQVETRLECQRSDVEHRAVAMGIEQRAMELGYRLALGGQVAFGILAVVAMVLGFILAWTGREVAGLGTIITALAVLAGSFLYGNYQRSKDSGTTREPEKKSKAK